MEVARVHARRTDHPRHTTELVDVLEEVRALVSRPDNDFSWSSWEDEADALKELDDLIQSVRAGGLPHFTLSVLFAPTGPLQELAISSGWGDTFLDVANRFDAAIAAVGRIP